VGLVDLIPPDPARSVPILIPVLSQTNPENAPFAPDPQRPGIILTSHFRNLGRLRGLGPDLLAIERERCGVPGHADFAP
jgi:hypothetical protein